ncbi:hypothetical protein Tco_1446533 [Tanacetum coccineum]
MLARCKETNLVLNWEKCHFMVKEGIVLGHKISRAGIEVDRAKIDVIAKLPYPTNVKGVRSFLGHAGFYRSICSAKKTLNQDLLGGFYFSKDLTLRLRIKRAENLAADHLSRLENLHGRDAKDYVMRCDACQRSGNISSRSEMPQNNIQSLLETHLQCMPTAITSRCLVMSVVLQRERTTAAAVGSTQRTKRPCVLNDKATL